MNLFATVCIITALIMSCWYGPWCTLKQFCDDWKQNLFLFLMVAAMTILIVEMK